MTTITTIRLSSDGFSVIEHDGTLHQVAWASVKEIFAFKLDMGTFDTIRLGFRVSDDGSGWQVDEDDRLRRTSGGSSATVQHRG